MTSDRPRHPLPASEEARHGEIPETLEAEKGLGADHPEQITPDGDAIDPSGEPYPVDPDA